MKRIQLTSILVLLILLTLNSCRKYYPVTLPLKINIAIEKKQYNINDEIQLGINYDFLDNKSKSAKIIIEAQKPVKVEDDEYILDDLQSLQKKDFEIKLAKPLENGYGEIRATLYTYDEDGNQLYSQSQVVYFLIDDDLVMLGENGTYILKIENLDMQLREGKITNEQYRKLKEELSREGAIVSSIITYNITNEIQYSINFDFFDNKSKSAKILIDADKPVQVEKDEYIFDDLQSLQNKGLKITLAKPLENGYGEIRASLFTYDEDDNQLYFKSQVVYFLIIDDLVMLSENGTYVLRIEYLNMQLREGKITNEQHKKLTEELSQESAFVSSTIMHGGE